MAPWKPIKLTDKFMYVFGTESMLDFEKRDVSFEHILKLTCAKQICSECEAMDDLSVDFEQFGKRIHVFWEESVDKFIDNLQLPRPFTN